MTAQFVADVGGTNIRLATVVNGEITDILKMLCNEHPTIEAAIKYYFSLHPEKNFTSGCIGIACPVNQDQVTMTNHSWAFSKKALQETLSLEHLSVINDFTAVAYSLPLLKGEQLLQVGEGQPIEGANIAVLGPGTGLGVEHLTAVESGWKTLDGEGGHVDFAPTNEDEIDVWRYVSARKGRTSTEDVLSGQGLTNIYNALNEKASLGLQKRSPAQITTAALDGSCDTCLKTLSIFCRVMGAFAGNIAANLATHGGVFIGGGIASRFTDFIQKSEFRTCFEAKGCVAEYIRHIPTYIILEPDHGLIGAYAFLNQQLASVDNE
ncbi:glucokinase [Alteromonas sp. 5E99-2]|uniref:glucokinase n=1 Tax=Alteromonas sp. 5E99-2 TaxID=2817683 RepID=UPI001A99260A|nr:glucokinase [Alteromonas sp. 5E99-2]